MADRFQENLFQRVAAVRQTMHLEILASGNAPDDVKLDARREHDAPTPPTFGNTVGVVLAKGAGEVAIVTRDLELDKAAIGAALLLEVRMVDNAACLENHDLITDLLHVTQKM